MTTWPRDQRTRPRTASSNPGPIHAPSTTDHKNCRVWRWFWWHRRPAPLSTPPTDLWIINPNQLRLLLVPGELVTRGRLQVSGQSHNSSVYGPTWLPQASTTITPPPSSLLHSTLECSPQPRWSHVLKSLPNQFKNNLRASLTWFRLQTSWF